MAEEKAPDQVWTLRVEGREHRVTAAGSVSRVLTWSVDDKPVAERKTMDDKVRLEAAGLGTVAVRFSGLGKPRRATLFGPDEQAQAATGLGGIDLEPEPGSPAAAHEEKIRIHPRRYALIQTVAGVAKVVVPLLLGLLAVRFALSLSLPSIPWPDIPWPSIPWPSIPWPDISWPTINLPAISMPGWLAWILERVKYVWPIVLAFVLARGEIRRRRRQDELRAQQQAQHQAPQQIQRRTEEGVTSDERRQSDGDEED